MVWILIAAGILSTLLLRLFLRLYQLKRGGKVFKFYRINWFWFWAMFIAYYATAAGIVLLYKLLVWILG
jgi:hypothetical protein